MMTPEFELALACCRWSYREDQPDAIPQIANHVDWGRFFDLIRRHRVQGLVARALRDNPFPMPTEVRDAISIDARAIAERNLRSTQMCSSLLDRFAKAGISVLFVKGLTLSTLAYGDPYAKLSADIDILVDPDFVELAAEQLRESGFQLVVPGETVQHTDFPRWHAKHKESAWRSPEADLNLDLHTALSDNPAVIPAVGLSSGRQQVAVGGAAELPTLLNDELFAYLCVHGAVSAWFRLKWLVDLAAFLSAAAKSETERLYRRALKLGAGRGPAQGLLLADRLSLLDLPPELGSELRSESMNRFLARLAFRALLHPGEPTARFMGTVPIHLSQLLLLPGWKFQMGELGRQGRQLFSRLA